MSLKEKAFRYRTPVQLPSAVSAPVMVKLNVSLSRACALKVTSWNERLLAEKAEQEAATLTSVARIFGVNFTGGGLFGRML